MIPEMTPEDIAGELGALDLIEASEEECSPLEWFLVACDRLILQTYAIRLAMREPDWSAMLEGLTGLANFCYMTAQHAAAMLGPEEIIELTRRKLEQVTGTPQSFVGMQGGFAAFKREDIVVPDRYEEP